MSDGGSSRAPALRGHDARVQARGGEPCVLILAGLDPSGGAGLLADAEAARLAGARPLCVPTALTVQSTTRARSFEPISPDYLRDAAQALFGEEAIGAIKIGMLASRAVAEVIAELLQRHPRLPVVLDPVLGASSGAPLFAGPESEWRAAVRSLWSRAIVTPNALEAQRLLERPGPLGTLVDLEQAARALLEAGAGSVLLKGGHAEGRSSIDLLARSNAAPSIDLLPAPRLLDADGSTRSARGTGCRLASALAARLALGDGMLEAARAAKAQVFQYLEARR